MESELNAQHPYIQKLDTIKEQGVVVINNIAGPLIYEKTYMVPDMLIILCHEGTMKINDIPGKTFKAHDVIILLPNQIVVPNQVSADYRESMIAISKKFHDHLQHTYPYTRYAPRYRHSPVTHLADAQYNSLLHAIELLQSITQSKSVQRVEMLSSLLSIILLMIGESHASSQSSNPFSLSLNEQLFNRFYEALIHHHKESHEMAFYARICCLSPKHFTEIIKKDTGSSPKEWITNFLVVRAKALLESRENHTIQQISNLLGFGEQSSFARFFKRETGMSPKDFRRRQR